MSRFFSEKFASLVPYTPGEQPQDKKYVKLNTNESPFPPSENVGKAVAETAERLCLYSDPECRLLRQKMSEVFSLPEDNIVMVNGSDEILNFAFMAFADEKSPLVFPEITYGFYPVFAKLDHIPYEEIPLKEDFSISVEDYVGIHKTVAIANPNAPTGIALPVSEIERILRANPENIVVVDEAYVDFGGESCVPLIHQYDNLLVTQTFSKSRSMAGARLGFGVGCKALIADLNTIKYSTNPYNINRMTMAAGIGVLSDEEYTRKNCETVMETRTYTAEKLKELGFTMTDSKTNFLFVSHPKLDGKKLYLDLKERGILVRHFDAPRLSPYNRITVGTREQMDALLAQIKSLLEEQA